MGENFHGSIQFPKKYVKHEEVLQHIRDEIRSDYQVGEIGNFGDVEIEEDEGLITLYDGSALYGRFEQLESALIALGAPFDRHSSCYYEYAPEYRFYRPDSGDVTVTQDAAGDVCIKARELRDRLLFSPEEACRKLRELLEQEDPSPRPLEEYIAPNPAPVQMLELSTAHISPETKEFLDEQTDSSFTTKIIVFDKDTYGWFIFVTTEDKQLEELPADLQRILLYAKEKGCTWIMLDCDAGEINELPTFDW